MVALAIGGSALLGAGTSIFGSSQQADAAGTAAANQLAEFKQIQEQLKPFMDLGYGAIGPLQNLTGTNAGGNPLTAPLTKPFNPTMADLSKTPGYQFALNQGLQATQNGFAAKGLANSGAALKGAAGYAQGLASTTYQQQFQNYLRQNQQIYNMLSGEVQGGQNAAANVASAGTQNTALANNYLLGGATASASGLVGAANALTGGANNYLAYNALTGGGMYGGGSGGGYSNQNQIDPALDYGIQNFGH